MTVASYGWRDLKTSLISAVVGAAAPSLTAFGPTGGIKQYAFAINDLMHFTFHIEHDILMGSTMFPHIHWSTDGTDTNTVKWEFTWVMATAHDQANFGADTVITLEEAGAGTAWRQMLTEDVTGMAASEPDSLMCGTLKRITNGGSENTDAVFALFADLHYQIGQYATPSRSPNFYTP